VYKRQAPADQTRLVEEYRDRYLNPYVAAERGYVDRVIDPAETRAAVAGALALLASKRERVVSRKHDNGPL